jgi:hypothetical protein
MIKKSRSIPELLPDFRSLYVNAFGMDEENHKKASVFFGTTASECESWFNDKPHPVAHRYLSVHCKGYLPYNTNWSDCYIDKDGTVVTPWGNCRPSDLAFLHRHKWSAEQTRIQLAKCRQKLAEIQSGTKIKMIIHTTDYLNRLIKELTTLE